MIQLSIIKNQNKTNGKKDFNSIKKKYLYLKNDLHVSQLDYYYLSSPASLKEKLSNYEDIDYKNMNYSNLYFGIDHYIKDQKKITQNLKNDKKVKK